MIQEWSKRRIELDPKAIGARIRSARRSRNWKRRDLARLMDVTPATITMWECGWRVPRGVTLLTLAGLLHRSVEWLLVGLPRNGKLWKLLVNPVGGRVHTPLAPVVSSPGVRATPGDYLLGEKCGEVVSHASPHALGETSKRLNASEKGYNAGHNETHRRGGSHGGGAFRPTATGCGDRTGLSHRGSERRRDGK